jgi:hypothetical protein
VLDCAALRIKHALFQADMDTNFHGRASIKMGNIAGDSTASLCRVSARGAS